jgi:hypothetical protein
MTESKNVDSPTHQQIEARAYEIYVERGYVDGNEVSHWLEAEAELTQQAAPTAEVASKDEPVVTDSKIEAPLPAGVRSRATVA